jgi:hypothetical protein
MTKLIKVCKHILNFNIALRKATILKLYIGSDKSFRLWPKDVAPLDCYLLIYTIYRVSELQTHHDLVWLINSSTCLSSSFVQPLGISENIKPLLLYTVQSAAWIFLFCYRLSTVDNNFILIENHGWTFYQLIINNFCASQSFFILEYFLNLTFNTL